MCTYQTSVVPVTGSAKGPDGWFPATVASVYYDHPVHAPEEHTVNVDVLNPDRGPASRVALELTPGAARALAHALLEVADSASLPPAAP